MAQLPKRRFFTKSNSGEKLNFECEISVNSKGIFSVRLPREIPDFLAAAKHISKEDKFKPTCVEKLREYHCVSGRDLELCCNLIERAAYQYLEYEAVEELVILYDMNAFCHYVKDKDGKIYANGHDARDMKGEEYHHDDDCWHGTHGRQSISAHAPFYFVGLYAHVWTKITKTRGTYVKVEFENPGNSLARKSYGERLNSTVRLYPEDFGRGSQERHGLKEMPYTEEAAKFFYEALMGICKLHDMIDGVINNEERLMEAIKKQSSFLLPSPDKKAVQNG